MRQARAPLVHRLGDDNWHTLEAHVAADGTRRVWLDGAIVTEANE